MAIHQENCEICERIAQCKAGEHPGFILEMETGYAVLGDSQFFRGYSLLLCKTPATELDELTPEIRLKYLEEMALLAEAVRKVVQPHKLNYECLGNMVHHLHWHIFPRYSDDEQREKPVWAHDKAARRESQYNLDPARDAPLMAAIRDELQQLMQSHPE
ncbi:MAG: HIT family protein [Abitibacteriaceae bacterium]|nr:HIT family protein [Abditibacteriaceae bacterium]